MRLTAAITASLVSLLMLAGCGSGSSYAGDAQSAIRTMTGAIRTYNAAQPRDVATTGAACRGALSTLGSASALVSETPPSRYAALGAALAHAYSQTTLGFSDCASGAATNDYPRMARAAQEIETANSWIGRAKALDH